MWSANKFHRECTGNSLQKYLPRNYNAGDIFYVSSNYQDPSQPHVSVEDVDFEFSVPYSTNKKQRWELPRALTKKLEGSDSDFEKDCVEIIESDANPPERRNPQTYRYMVKNGKQKSQNLERTNINRRSMYKTNCNETSNEEIDRRLVFDFLWMNRCIKVTKKRHSYSFNDKERTSSWKKKVTDYDLQDALDAISDDAREEYWNDGADDIDNFERQRETAEITLSDCLITHPKVKLKKRKGPRNSKSLSTDCTVTKNRKAKKSYYVPDSDGSQLDEQISVSSDVFEHQMDRKAIDNHEDFVVMESIRMKFRNEELQSVVLRSLFNDCFIETDSVPRKFAIRLTENLEGHHFIFLVFEEVTCGDKETVWDIFINADVVGVDRLSLAHVEESFTESHIHLPQFVRCCTQLVKENFSDNLVERDISILHFGTPSSPLFIKEPTVLKLPLRVESWIKESHSEGEKIDGEMDEAIVIVNATCEICKDYVEIDATASTFDDAESNLKPGSCMNCCQHFLCNNCWSSYLRSQIRKCDFPIYCPVENCTKTVDFVMILRFVPLQSLMTNAFHLETQNVLLDKRMVQCPNVSCGRLIRIEKPPTTNEALNVRCLCDHRFCFSCKDEAHWPASCRMFEVFKQKAVLSGDWDLVNNLAQPVELRGKRCPSCGEFTERRGGHYIITCKCKEKFCWRCLSIVHEQVRVYLPPFMCRCKDIRKEAPLERLKLGPFVGPSSSRSRSYYYILKCRSKRLRLKVEPARLQQMMYKVKFVMSEQASFDGNLYKEVMKELADTISNFMEIFRVVEFCYLASFMTKKSNGTSIRLLEDCASALLMQAKRIREILDGKACGNAHQQIELMQSCFTEARRKLKDLHNLKVLRDERAIRQ